MRVEFLLQSLRTPLSDIPFKAQLAGKRNLLTDSIHRALKRLGHRHALIPELEPWIGERLDLRDDGLGHLPLFSSRLNFRAPGRQFLNETLEIDPIVTRCRGDSAIRAYGTTSLLRAAGTQRGEAHDGKRKGSENLRRNMNR